MSQSVEFFSSNEQVADALLEASSKKRARVPALQTVLKHQDIMRLLDMMDRLDEILGMHHAIIQGIVECKCEACGHGISLSESVTTKDVDLSMPGTVGSF